MSSTSETCRHIFEDVNERLHKKVRYRFMEVSHRLITHSLRFIVSDGIYEPLYNVTFIMRRNLINKNKEYEFENSVN